MASLPAGGFPNHQRVGNTAGGEPDIIASSVAAPLERQFADMAGLTEMTSASYLGSTSITLQLDLSRNIDGAARDVEAAINAARANLPSDLRTIPLPESQPRRGADSYHRAYIRHPRPRSALRCCLNDHSAAPAAVEVWVR